MKVCCQERRCGWIGEQSELLHFKHPFDDTETVGVCPKCKTIETSIWQACDEPGCARAATSGTPTPAGYRNTCGDHMPVMAQE